MSELYLLAGFILTLVNLWSVRMLYRHGNRILAASAENLRRYDVLVDAMREAAKTNLEAANMNARLLARLPRGPRVE